MIERYFFRMPRNKRGLSKEELPQRTLYSSLEKMLTRSPVNWEESLGTGLGENRNNDLRSLILVEFAKTNENI